MKKVLSIIGFIAIVLVIGVGIYLFINNQNMDNNKDNINDGNGSMLNNNNNNNTSSKKVLVVYYSAQGHTEAVAKKIAANLNADMFEIVPKDVYTSDDLNWSDEESRVSKEHDEESLRDIELKNTKVDNWNSYDTVLIGYPIWWGIAAWPVNNFVKDNDFTGKTVIPFCTSASSGIGQSGKLLEDMTNVGNWKTGQRFSSNASDADIKSFTDSIK